MELTKRIEVFVALRNVLQNLHEGEKEALFRMANSENSWFDTVSVEKAISGIITMLEPEKLNTWASQYQLDAEKTIGIIAAGNIPAVGFHDVLCVLISGGIAHVKLSSQDTVLIKKIRSLLLELEPDLANQFVFVEKIELETVDGVIATGSDNTARYFHQYFSKRPHIIRKNRTSIAVLTGKETPEEIKALGDDIFTYYGLGCRNVSKLLLPKGYDVAKLYEPLEERSTITKHHKYANNYDYNRSVYLVNRVEHLDNGFLILKEDQALVSPISVLFFEYYETQQDIDNFLSENEEKIQCVVGKGYIPFGQAQFPTVDDYADGVDTLSFISKL